MKEGHYNLPMFAGCRSPTQRSREDAAPYSHGVFTFASLWFPRSKLGCRASQLPAYQEELVAVVHMRENGPLIEGGLLFLLVRVL